jgi:lipoprotein NlpI
MYLKHVSNDWTPLEKLRSGSDSVTNSFIDYFAVLSLYHRAAYQAALEVFDSTRTEVGSKYTRGFILPELPDGSQLAWKEVERLRQLNPSTWDTMAIQLTLRLLGRKDEAINMCRQARDHAQPMPPWRRDWYRRLLDYSCGDLSETQLIKAAGSSRYSQCEAHFFIGITKLGEGDRRAAREHFRAAVATRIFFYLDYDWSHAFLARMEKDPNWPGWVPAKPE